MTAPRIKHANRIHFATVLYPLIIIMILPVIVFSGEIIENDSFSGEKTTVKFAMYGEAGEVDITRQIFRKFVDKNPDIRVDVSVYPWGQYWAKLQVQAASGLAPDVMTLYSGIMGVWVSRGALLPLDSFIDESRSRSFRLSPYCD